LGVPKEVLSEPALSEALKVLRLLHLHDLRQLQDEINDAIEMIQSYTADPKTDTKLGQVGR
jgi:RLL motif-containing protein 1